MIAYAHPTPTACKRPAPMARNRARRAPEWGCARCCGPLEWQLGAEGPTETPAATGTPSATATARPTPSSTPTPGPTPSATARPENLLAIVYIAQTGGDGVSIRDACRDDARVPGV